MNEYERILEIDKELDCEVEKEMAAMEKSYEKYGHIYRSAEFLTSNKKKNE